MSWGEIYQGMAALQAQDVRNRQKQVAEMQLADAQEQRAEKQAVNQAYDKLAGALQKSGDIEDLAGMVTDGPSLMALSRVVQDYAGTQEGINRGAEAAMQRGVRNYGLAHGYISRAMQSQVGSPDWVSSVQSAATVAPLGFRLGDYNPETQSFTTMQADPLQGWVAGEQMSVAEVQELMGRVAQGGAPGQGPVPRWWGHAQMGWDQERTTWNADTLGDPSRHIMLTKGDETLIAIPQRHETPGGGFVYLIQGKNGLTPVESLEGYVQDGWRVTDQAQMNKEMDQHLKRRGQDITSAGQMVDKEGKPLTPSQALTAVNQAISQSVQGLEQILSRWAGGVDTSGMDHLDALMAVRQAALPTLRSEAEKGNQRAVSELAMYDRLWVDYQELLARQVGLAKELSASQGGGVTPIHHEMSYRAMQDGVMYWAKDPENPSAPPKLYENRGGKPFLVEQK